MALILYQGTYICFLISSGRNGRWNGSVTHGHAKLDGIPSHHHPLLLTKLQGWGWMLIQDEVAVQDVIFFFFASYINFFFRIYFFINFNFAASPPRRKEIDNVMKKARKEGTVQSQYWNKKLLEVEEKDPNRWRHSGYKELYGEKSSSRSKSRSPVGAKRPVPSKPR